MSSTNVPPASSRSRSRRNVIRNSPNRKEYERLIQAGWSSISLERYAAFRYGEDIPNQTFRSYRAKMDVQRENKDFKVDVDETVDIMGLRADLIRLQAERIGIDYRLEKSMGKLFGSLRPEIDLLDSLLDSHKRDLQDVGIMPKSPEQITVSSGPSPAEAPTHTSLAQLLGATDASEQVEADIAKVLHLNAKAAKKTA